MAIDQDWTETVTDKSGEAYTLRCVRESDKQLFIDGLAALSPESIYNRFLSAKSRFTESELAYLTMASRPDHVGIVAIDPEGKLVAVGRGVLYVDAPQEADLGLIVADCRQGSGLGRIVLQRVLAALAERGVQTVRGEMFSSNTRMFRLVDTLGLEVDWLLAGPVAHMAIDIRPLSGE